MGRQSSTQDDTWVAGERDTLELVARLLVGGSHRVPVEGRSSRPVLSSSDVAGALGYMRNPLERAVAIAVATRATGAGLAKVGEAAFAEVERSVRAQRPVPLNLDEGADAARLRLVIRDAAHALVWPEHRAAYADLARAAKMRRALYRQVNRVATAVLQEALNDARRHFRAALWGGC